MLTSSGIKDKQKVSNYKSCLGTMNHGPIKGAIMFLVLFFFFWSVPPSPPPPNHPLHQICADRFDSEWKRDG